MIYLTWSCLPRVSGSVTYVTVISDVCVNLVSRPRVRGVNLGVPGKVLHRGIEVTRVESWVPTSASSVQRSRETCVLEPSRGCSTPGLSVQRPRLTIVSRRGEGADLCVERPTTANGCRVSAVSCGSLWTLKVRRFDFTCRVACQFACMIPTISGPPRKPSARRRRGKPRPGKRHRDCARARAAARLTVTTARPVSPLPPPTAGHLEYDPETPSLNFTATPTLYNPEEAAILPSLLPSPFSRKASPTLLIPAMVEPPTEPLPLPQVLFHRGPTHSPRVSKTYHVSVVEELPPTPGKWYDPCNFNPDDLPEEDVLLIPLDSSPEKFSVTPTKNEHSVKRSLFRS